MGSSDGGISNDDTLADEPRDQVRPRRFSFGAYEVSSKIGEGGMGEVLLARDGKIGRDVAIKRVRTTTPTPEIVDRFLREAKIQARLDHPAIVPVYDLGHDADGLPYFTMKRLAGTTLLERLTRGDATLQSLLRAFVDVCQAIDFAHSRGVVHRDLKPANIILGDFGEVYVLDWGVARLLARDNAMTPAVGSPSVAPGADGQTQAGAVLGTPGYMAPEQARGDAVATPADVFSLGQILFDILAAETRAGRAVPPELETIAEAAHAQDPQARPSARELGQSVQSYLDGDRDHERRAELASELVSRARAVAGDPLLRANAIRDAGRALALDPDSQDAAALVMTLMLEPPKQLPDHLQHKLAQIDEESARESARHASRALMSGFLTLPILLVAGVASWPLLVGIFGLLAVLAAHAHYQRTAKHISFVVPLCGGMLLLVLLTRAVGPLVLSPTLVGLYVIGVGSQPTMLARPWLVLGCGMVAFFAPFALEAANIFAPTWQISGGNLVATSRLFALDGPAAYAFLIGANVLLIVVMFAFMRELTASRRAARTQVEIQAWQLQQLLPAPPPSAELAALVAADCD